MDKQKLDLLNEINRVIIRLRCIYSSWLSAHGISYNEMLILYTLREYCCCTQKQICDNYLLPRQTINHVVAMMRQKGLLELNKEFCTGHEKVFVLTGKGRNYAEYFLKSLNNTETRAVKILGGEKLETLTSLMLEYTHALKETLNKEEL